MGKFSVVAYVVEPYLFTALMLVFMVGCEGLDLGGEPSQRCVYEIRVSITCSFDTGPEDNTWSESCIDDAYDCEVEGELDCYDECCVRDFIRNARLEEGTCADRG